MFLANCFNVMGVERAAAPLWELAMLAGTDEAPDDFIGATATAERYR